MEEISKIAGEIEFAAKVFFKDLGVPSYYISVITVGVNLKQKIVTVHFGKNPHKSYKESKIGEVLEKGKDDLKEIAQNILKKSEAGYKLNI